MTEYFPALVLDKSNKTMYLHVQPGVFDHSEQVNDYIFVDYDCFGNVLGVEYLSDQITTYR